MEKTNCDRNTKLIKGNVKNWRISNRFPQDTKVKFDTFRDSPLKNRYGKLFF